MSAKNSEVRLRPLAQADLEEIWLYTLKNWSLEQADKYVLDLYTAMNLLACGEKVGRACSVRDGYFQYSVGSHIVFYRVTNAGLDITRILHQRMDLQRHL
jgi:toxin ParE1/3/4